MASRRIQESVRVLSLLLPIFILLLISLSSSLPLSANNKVKTAIVVYSRCMIWSKVSLVFW